MAAVVAAILVCCPASAQPTGVSGAKSIRDALLRLVQRRDPDASTGPVRAQLDVYELELREKLEGVRGGRARARCVAEYFFKDQQFSSNDDLASADSFYVDRVLLTRQGYCLSLSAIILAVTDRLDLPIKGVASPRHFFLRWDDGTTRLNIETTESGAVRDDAYYRKRGVSKEAEAEGLYLKSLDVPRVIAYLTNNEGYILLRRGQAKAAETRFREALRLHPLLLEARINLGIVAAERGDTKAADAEFAKVQRWLPTDAPTRLNRALAALRAGRYADALDGVRDAQRLDPGNPALAQYRDSIIATVLQPSHWDRYQSDMVRRGEKLRASGRLRRGLAATYFSRPDLTGKEVRRVDREVRFEWRWSAPVRGIPADDFSARWEGLIDLPSSGTWVFYTVVNDGVRLWVDGLPIIDNWKRNEGALDRKSLNLRKGLHTLRIEYFEHTRFAGITFEAKRADQDRPLRGRLWHESR